MSRNWILVANASQARLYANHGVKKGLSLVKEFTHPESREKASELASDQKSSFGQGNGKGSFVEIDPKENEMEHFALELAKELEDGRTHNHYTRLVLVSSPHFLGLLKARLTPHVRDLVSDTVEKDYVRASEKELAGHLESVIYL
jgi:protein required for attachment to host cells